MLWVIQVLKPQNFILKYSGSEQKVSLKDSNTWKTYTIDNIQITSGQCEVGVYVKSSQQMAKYR